MQRPKYLMYILRVRTVEKDEPSAPIVPYASVELDGKAVCFMATNIVVVDANAVSGYEFMSHDIDLLSEAHTEKGFEFTLEAAQVTRVPEEGEALGQ